MSFLSGFIASSKLMYFIYFQLFDKIFLNIDIAPALMVNNTDINNFYFWKCSSVFSVNSLYFKSSIYDIKSCSYHLYSVFPFVGMYLFISTCHSQVFVNCNKTVLWATPNKNPDIISRTFEESDIINKSTDFFKQNIKKKKWIYLYMVINYMCWICNNEFTKQKFKNQFLHTEPATFYQNFFIPFISLQSDITIFILNNLVIIMIMVTYKIQYSGNWFQIKLFS